MRFVIEHQEPTITMDPARGHELWTWVGPDDRGVELEVVAADVPDCLLVFHVMPTALRRGGRR